MKSISRWLFSIRVANLLLLTFSVAFAVVVGELGMRYRLRAWPFEIPQHLPDYLTTKDVSLRWRFPPAEKRNSLGLQNREVGPKKAGSYRILLLGDSLIWNFGRIYTEDLERRLNSRHSDTFGAFEVINAGIPGYTTYQELEFLKIYGMNMKPDLVILGFVFNDLYYKYLHKPTKQRLLSDEPAAHLHHLNPYGFPGVFFSRSYLANEAVDEVALLWQRMLRRPRFEFERRTDFYLAWKSHGWINARKLIGEMKSLVTENRTALVVVVFPVSDQVNAAHRKLDEAYVLYPQGKILEICKAFGVPALDLTEPLFRKGGVSLYSDYLHLNHQGNGIVTDELEKYLVKTLALGSPVRSHP